MKRNEFRELNDIELQILRRMMDTAITQVAALGGQIAAAQVKPLDEYGSLEFKVAGGTRVQAPDGPIIDAIQPDADTIESYGPYVNYVLFVKAGFITELQIYKDDGGPIRNPIDPDKIVSAFKGKC